MLSEIILLMVLVISSAFFSFAETAVTSIGRLKVEEFAEKKKSGYRSLVWLKDNPSSMLATLLFGNNLVNISASALATSVAISYLASIGFGSAGTAVGISIGIMTFLILVFGEIIPKTVAIRTAEKSVLIVAPIVRFISIVLYPFIQVFIWVSTPFVHLFGGRMPKRGPFLTKEEMMMLLSIGEKEGILEEEEREMISSIFEFGATIAREVMTPRPDMQCVEVSDPVDKLNNLISEGGHSRIPVYEGSLDNIVGVVYAKDLLRLKAQCDPSVNLRDLLRPALFIPEAKRVDSLLHEMQAARTHIAIVVDEYGGTAGVVTMEDIVEEIVGEIYDEFEKKVKNVEKVDDNTTIVDARTNISDLNSMLSINLPEKDYDTLGGFIFGLLGKVPAVGDQAKYDNISISVERVHKRRITRAKIVKLAKTPAAADEGESVGG